VPVVVSFDQQLFPADFADYLSACNYISAVVVSPDQQLLPQFSQIFQLSKCPLLCLLTNNFFPQISLIIAELVITSQPLLLLFLSNNFFPLIFYVKSV
jgi:hypothetical protein